MPPRIISVRGFIRFVRRELRFYRETHRRAPAHGASPHMRRLRHGPQPGLGSRDLSSRRFHEMRCGRRYSLGSFRGSDCRLVHQGHRHSRQRTRTSFIGPVRALRIAKIQRRWGSSTRLKCCAPWPPALRCPFLSASTTPSGSRPPSWCSGPFRESPVNRRGRGLFPRSSSHMERPRPPPASSLSGLTSEQTTSSSSIAAAPFGTSVSRPRLHLRSAPPPSKCAFDVTSRP